VVYDFDDVFEIMRRGNAALCVLMEQLLGEAFALKPEFGDIQESSTGGKRTRNEAFVWR
jgi:hypothetical protein